jgi:hypothetical protein
MMIWNMRLAVIEKQSNQNRKGDMKNAFSKMFSQFY